MLLIIVKHALNIFNSWIKQQDTVLFQTPLPLFPDRLGFSNIPATWMSKTIGFLDILTIIKE